MAQNAVSYEISDIYLSKLVYCRIALIPSSI